MCGIAAVFSDFPDLELQEKTRLSLDLVAHRGPDGAELFVAPLAELLRIAPQPGRWATCGWRSSI